MSQMVVRKPAHLFLEELGVPFEDEGNFVRLCVGVSTRWTKLKNDSRSSFATPPCSLPRCCPRFSRSVACFSLSSSAFSTGSPRVRVDEPPPPPPPPMQHRCLPWCRSARATGLAEI